jgi:uncharacterized membrane protein
MLYKIANLPRQSEWLTGAGASNLPEMLRASSEPVVDEQARSAIYNAQVDGFPLSIEIAARSCTDSMSGEQFETAVSINLGDRTLTGCGRALHQACHTRKVVTA